MMNDKESALSFHDNIIQLFLQIIFHVTVILPLKSQLDNMES